MLDILVHNNIEFVHLIMQVETQGYELKDKK